MARSLKVLPQHIEQIKSSLLRNGFVRQQDLAEDLNISRDTVSKFCNGKPVGYLNFLEICGRLGLEMMEIADYEGNNNQNSFKLKHNLPRREYTKFIGRQEELKELLKYISPEYRQHITVVEGIGGVGKTALVVEAAYICVEQNNTNKLYKIPQFDAIIFTSAKDSYLKPLGIVPRAVKQTTLREIFGVIAETFDDPIIMQAQGEEQCRLVYKRFSKQKTLLIVDNMETIEGQDRQDILAFLSDLPFTTQAIITTREKILLYSPIRVESLLEENSIQLIDQQVREKEVLISKEEIKGIYERFGGIPLALIYAVGQRSAGYSFEYIISLDRELPKDIASFCFDGSVIPLQGKPEYLLLMSIAIFAESPLQEAIAQVSGLTQNYLAVERGLARLEQLSLIRELNTEGERRYKILSMTKEYALSKLKANPDFQQKAYDRWVNYYISFTKQHGGKDWQDWRAKYDNYLHSEWINIQEVLSWCGENNRYQDVKEILIHIDNYIDIQGKWQVRHDWWTWLINRSKSHSDYKTYVMALGKKAWTLFLMPGDNNDLAKNLLDEALNLIQEADRETQVCLYLYLAVFHIGKVLKNNNKGLNTALKSLETAKTILDNSQLDEKNKMRLEMLIFYYSGEAYYHQWQLDKENKYLLGSAQKTFRKVIAQGKKIGWQRFTNYAQNWLAEILIIKNNLSKAEEVLKLGLDTAIYNRENRRIAHYKATYARFEKARRNRDKACEYAMEALSIFEKEDIRIDAAELRELLKELSCDRLGYC